MPHVPVSVLPEYIDMKKAMRELPPKKRILCVRDEHREVPIPSMVLYIGHITPFGIRYCNFTCGEGPHACCYHPIQGTSRAVPCLGVGDRIFLYTVGKKCPGLFYCKFPNMTLKEAVDLFVKYVSDKN